MQLVQGGIGEAIQLGRSSIYSAPCGECDWAQGVPNFIGIPGARRSLPLMPSTPILLAPPPNSEYENNTMHGNCIYDHCKNVVLQFRHLKT
jgi:hypothetical protein